MKDICRYFIRASLSFLLFPFSFLTYLVLLPRLLICQVGFFGFCLVFFSPQCLLADFKDLTWTHDFSLGAVGLLHQLVLSAFSSLFSALVL